MRRVAVVVVPSIEAESMCTQIGRERRTFCLGGLPGLVFRPAVKGRVAKFRVGTMLLLGNGMQRVPPSVVIVDSAGKRTVIVTIAVRRDLARQAQADVTLALGIAEAKSRDWKNQIRQSQKCCDLVDLVANDADGADTQPDGFRAQDHGLHRQCRIDAGVEETLQRSLANRLSAHFADTLQ